MQWVLGSTRFVGEEIRGLQFVVADELEQASVEQVRSTFGHYVDLRARLAAELRRRGGRNNAQVLHSLGDSKIIVPAVDLRVEVVDAIAHPINGLRPPACCCGASSLRASG